MRFVAVAERMQVLAPDVHLVGIGSERPDRWDGPWVSLPRDDVPILKNADERAGGALHWAPVMHGGMRERSVKTAAWIGGSNCKLLVVDVSVEMLLLGRLCSVPTVAMAMRGKRQDRPHVLGYDVARAILAPWPAETQERLPEAWAEKLIAVGSFSRFDSSIKTSESNRGRTSGRNVLLILGRGGHNVNFGDVARAAVATPDWNWQIMGVSSEEASTAGGGNVSLLGIRSDVWPILQDADVVVGPCGDNTVSEVAAARKPFIALPQARPFDEQVAHARVLEAHDFAQVAWTWPEGSAWPALLELALSRGGGRWSSYNDGHGADRATEAIVTLAGEMH